jgi:hypothetical protein
MKIFAAGRKLPPAIIIMILANNRQNVGFSMSGFRMCSFFGIGKIVVLAINRC